MRVRPIGGTFFGGPKDHTWLNVNPICNGLYSQDEQEGKIEEEEKLEHIQVSLSIFSPSIQNDEQQ